MIYPYAKRLFDIIASGVAIIILSPIFLIAVIGIEVSDPGPVFYKAQRIGKDNKQFIMYKFRSMREDKTANESSFKADTNRIFPFGALIRLLKIDELPQLFNVFAGTMSVIGPRPASVDQVHIVRAGKYSIVSSVKVGLSSPSALYDYIYGDSVENAKNYEELVLPRRLELDLYYLRHKSIKYDLLIIWYTIICILNSLFGLNAAWVLDRLLNDLDNDACAHSKQTEITVK